MADLEQMDADVERMESAAASFSDFVVQIEREYGLCLIEQRALTDSVSGKDSLQITLTPRNLSRRHARDARWLSQDRSGDAYVPLLDAIFVASDEFHCFALATTTVSIEKIESRAKSAGLFVHVIRRPIVDAALA